MHRSGIRLLVLGRSESTLPTSRAVAPLPGARRLPGPAGATSSPPVFISTESVPAAVLPASPDASGSAVQLAPVTAAVFLAAAASYPRNARVAGQGAPVRAVRAARAGLGVRAGGAAGALAELVPGAGAARLPAGARRVGRPSAGAQLHDPRHAAGLGPEEYRAYGEWARRRNPGLTPPAMYIPCV